MLIWLLMISEDNSLWRILLTKDFQTNEKEMSAPTEVLKKLYEKKHQSWKGARLYRGPAPYLRGRGAYVIDPKRDYKEGTRFVIKEEFLFAVHHLNHTFMIPFKVLFYWYF